jgi:hypothetical protein
MMDDVITGTFSSSRVITAGASCVYSVYNNASDPITVTIGTPLATNLIILRETNATW